MGGQEGEGWVRAVEEDLVVTKNTLEKTLPQPKTSHPLTTDCIHVSLLHFWLLYDFVDYDRRRSVTLVLFRLHALISDSFVIFSKDFLSPSLRLFEYYYNHILAIAVIETLRAFR